jgi:tetratricopeptide (TPR) repeat protein
MATNLDIDDTDFEIFTLVWVDGAINEPENKQTQNDLRKLSNQFKTFDNSNECKLYIQSLSIDERIMLIVSGQLGREIVPCIHKIEQIYTIYVYCFDAKTNGEWVKPYFKIKSVLTNKDALIKQIRLDNKKEIDPINNDPLYINIHGNNPNDQFIHSQLLIDYLLKTKNNSTIDTQFFTLCKTECAEDNLQLKNFEENSSSKNILWWLTKDKFLSKIITKSLQTRNIDLFYSSRFFIHDINQQLQSNKCATTIHVYHSHAVTNEEFEQLKNSVGKLISINTFFLTTFQRDKSLLSLKQTNNQQKILFEIQADPSIDRVKPFADIRTFSYSTKQSQILFMLGSIFRIINVYQQNDIWICQMNLSSRTDPDLKTIFEQISKEDEDSGTDLLAYGNLLARIGLYDDAEKYYQHILNELPANHEDTHVCYRNLGNVAYLKKEYDKSLEYHSKSLEIKKHFLKPTDPSIADSYNCLGIVYFDKKEYKQAIDSYEKGLEIIKLSSATYPSKVAIILVNIGLVYRTQTDYPKALEYYQQALDIEKQYFRENSSDFGQLYHTIGALYWCRGYYNKAMEYYNFSLENKAKYLPSNHPSIAMTLENIGLIYENKNNFEEACKYYEQASAIYEQTLLSTHADVIQIKDNILRVSSYLK